MTQAAILFCLDVPRIDHFFRTDPSRSNVEGAGLGLAIAKWIAEMHHAELSVVSMEYKGTTFQVVFPLCEAWQCPALSTYISHDGFWNFDF